MGNPFVILDIHFRVFRYFVPISFILMTAIWVFWCECLDNIPTSVASAACEDDPSHRPRPYITVKTLVGRISGCCKGVAVRDTGQTINHPHPSSCGQHPTSCVHILKLIKTLMKTHVDGFVQDCSNSTANALELLQSCTKPSIYVSLSASHVKTWTTTRPTHTYVFN